MIKRLLLPTLVLLCAVLLGAMFFWPTLAQLVITSGQSAIAFLLNGVGIGTATSINCSTNLTCINANGAVTMSANEGGGGVQTNQVNDWTAKQIFSDVQFNGPTPYIDIRSYGGYANIPLLATTGSISGSSSTLTLAGAIDFANGQGIVVYGAGAPVSITTPTGLMVSSENLTNGTTTYSYKVVSEDYSGGLTATSAAGSTSTGPPALGLTSVSISTNGCVASNGLMTVTTTANHGFSVRAPVNLLLNSTGSPAIEGAFTIHTVPAANEFTFYTNGPNGTYCPSGGTAQVVAKNLLQWNHQDYGPIRSFIYRSVNGGAYTFAGVAQGMDTSFEDVGYATSPPASYVPTTPPSSSTNQWLSSTISSGAGTTTLTLANAASATVNGAVVLHDNTPNVITACNVNTNGGTIVFPNVTTWTFNTTLNMAACHEAQWRLLFASNPTFNESLIPKGFIDSLPGPTKQVGFPNYGDWNISFGGNAYPIVYLPPGTSSGSTLRNIRVAPSGAYQSAVVQDQDSGGNNVVQLNYENSFFSNQSGAGIPFIMKGGFGFIFDRGGFQAGGGGHYFDSQPTMLMTVNQGLGICCQQLPGIVYMDKTVFVGPGIVMDGRGFPSVTNGSHMRFYETLLESGVTPIFTSRGGTQQLGTILFDAPSYADQLGGTGTALFDLTDQRVTDFNVVSPGTNQGPIMTGSLNATAFPPLYIYNSAANGQYTNTLVNTNLLSQGTAKIGTAMGSLAAPSVSAGGAGTIPAGTYYYQILPEDFNNNTGIASPYSSITVDGSHSVNITWNNTFGQASSTICRGTSPSNVLCCAASNCFNVTGTSYSDNLPSFDYTTSQSGINNAIAIGMTKNGFISPIIGMPPTSFSTLGSVPNGTEVYCSDCTIANPCAGGGTGAFAKRLNGVWVCN
jgi:hypothetical protein